MRQLDFFSALQSSAEGIATGLVWEGVLDAAYDDHICFK
jgi:hypothetical protein